jgi:site-specific DNA-methyltransferase (adenine-specific)
MIERNSVIHGDCLEVMKDIEDESIDMILCDLPYGTTACKWDTIIPFDLLWDHYKRIIKDNGAIVLTGSQPFSSRLIMSNLEMFKYEWIWKKNTSAGFIHAKNKPLKRHENILIFSKGTTVHKGQSKNRMTYNPQGLLEKK